MNSNITIIGSGKVAVYLAKTLESVGHHLNEIYSRTFSNANLLASALSNCKPVQSLDFRNSKSALFIIAINDDAVSEIVQHIKLPPNALIVHTAGSVNMEILNTFKNYGVFYPIQTFSEGRTFAEKNIPIAIEASNEKNLHQLSEIAHTLSNQVYTINEKQRKAIHLAAVFSCNFSNHLYRIAESILEKEKIPLAILHPLLVETQQKALELGPSKAQTGPAVRGDQKIISQHLDNLQNEPEIYQLYQLFSELIQKDHLRKQA